METDEIGFMMEQTHNNQNPHPSPLPEGEGHYQSQNPHPSPVPHPDPLPEGEGHSEGEGHCPNPNPVPHQNPHPEGEGHSEGEGHYRGGFDFSGLVETARQLRKKQTPAESVMWELLRNRRFMNLKFRRQHQFGNYIADFYCNEQKLIVELDGKVHNNKNQAKHDHKRDAYLASMGLTVLRFGNKEFLANPENILNRIADAINCHPPLYNQEQNRKETTKIAVFKGKEIRKWESKKVRK